MSVVPLLLTLSIQACTYPFETNSSFKANSYSTSAAGPRSDVGSASGSKARGPGFDPRSGHILSFPAALIQEGTCQSLAKIYMHLVLVNHFRRSKLGRE